MRYRNRSAASYCGVDLHARTRFLYILDAAGTIHLKKNLPAQPTPFRDDILVGCECVHTWYWLADTCREHAIPFALGHAFGIQAVHASKTKSDAHDAADSVICSAPGSNSTAANSDSPASGET